MDHQQIEAILESDDEFPSTYNEEPSPPAYQNDYRFDPIVFKWIESLEVSVSKQKGKSNNFGIGNIKTGYLSQSDLFCLQSVAKNSSDDTFLWLVNFFIHKDIQSRYGNNLKSCLITKYPEIYDFPKIEGQQFFKKKYKIVVKV